MKFSKTTVVGILVSVALISSMSPSQAIGPIISGTIKDAFGIPLSGARVSDGTRSMTTGADGKYSFTETTPGTYVITASKANYVTDSTAPINTATNVNDNHDLSLLYTVSTSLDGRYLSTASSTRTLTHSLVTPAPDPNVRSCAFSKDTTTGQTSPMTYQSSSGGQATWTWSKALAVGSAEGNFSVQGWVENCSNGSSLDLHNAAQPFTVDNTTPQIIQAFPHDGINVLAENQPLMALIDEGNHFNVVPSNVRFTVIDLTPSDGQPVTTTSIAATSFSGRWAKSPAVAIASDHTYGLVIEVSDLAGNSSAVASQELSKGGGFIGVSLTFVAASASINGHPCETADDPTSLSTQLALCRNVPISAAPSTVGVSSSRHGYDRAYVAHSIPLNTARLRATIGVPGAQQTEEINAYNAADSRWGLKTIYGRFDLPSAADLPATLHVTGGSTKVPLLVVTGVPLTWTQPTLHLDRTTLPKATSCADPVNSSGGLQPCSPDPLFNRFAVSLKAELPIEATAKAQLDQGLDTFDLIHDEAPARSYEGELNPETVSRLAASPDVLGVQRGKPIETLVESDFRFREAIQMGLTRTEIVSLYRKASTSTRTRKDGALFTPLEAGELRARNDAAVDTLAIEDYVSENGLGSIFGGGFIDHSTGQLLVGFKSDAAYHMTQLQSILQYPNRLAGRTITWSRGELQSKAQQVSGDLAILADEGIRVHFVSPRVSANRVIVGVDSAPDVTQRLTDRYGAMLTVRVIAAGGEELNFVQDCVDKLQGCDVPSIPEDEAIARWNAGYRGGARAAIGGSSCTLGFNMFDLDWADPNSYGIFSAGHCGEPGQPVANGGGTGLTVKKDLDVQDSEADVLSAGQHAKWASNYYIITGVRSYVPTLRVHSNGYDVEGSTRCMSGAQSGFHCGPIRDTSVTWCPMDDDSLSCNYDMVMFESSKDSIGGDSGSPIWYPKNGGAYASGILAGVTGPTWPYENNIVYTRWAYWPGTANNKCLAEGLPSPCD